MSSLIDKSSFAANLIALKILTGSSWNLISGIPIIDNCLFLISSIPP